jgi:hypothetical protein
MAPSGVYMCARHWRMVPRPLRDAVYDSFRRDGGIAGARKPRPDELQDILLRIEEGESALVGQVATAFVNSIVASAPLPFSHALGTAIIGEPKRSIDLFKHIVADSDRLDHQMYAWPMLDPQPFSDLIPAAGAQGFWNWS